MDNPERITDAPFVVLGYNASNFFFFSYYHRTIIILKGSQLRWKYLSHLANLDYWAKHFKESDRRHVNGVNWKNVKEQLTIDANNVGLFEGLKYLHLNGTMRKKKQTIKTSQLKKKSENLSSKQGLHLDK